MRLPRERDKEEEKKKEREEVTARRRSRYEHEFLYRDLIARDWALPGRENKGDFAVVMTFRAATRGCARWPIYSSLSISPFHPRSVGHSDPISVNPARRRFSRLVQRLTFSLL